MKKKKLKLSVGIPAHNEERNIARLLESILSQNHDSFILHEVVVICDGCTDQTAAIVSRYVKKNKAIKLVNDGQRLGKSRRLGFLFKNNTSDVLICLDADIILGTKRVFEKIVRSFIDHPSVALVGSNDKPQRAKNFFESIAVVWIDHWQRLTRPINNWVNPHNNHGCLFALRDKLIKGLKVPEHITADDSYIFHENSQRGFEFIYCREAVVYFKAPSNFRDFVNQSVRFSKSGQDVYKYFPEAKADYRVSFKDKAREYTRSWLKEPFRFSMAIFLQAFIRLSSSLRKKNYANGVWETIKSSK